MAYVNHSMTPGMQPESTCVVGSCKPRTRMRLEMHTINPSIDRNKSCYNFRMSPFDLVPIEVLGNIFLEYYYNKMQDSEYFIGANWARKCRSSSRPQAATHHSPVSENDLVVQHPASILSRVCRTWRRVYLNTPQLWCSIKIWLNFPYHFYSEYLHPSTAERKRRDMSDIINEIKIHISRSKAVPLSVEIHTNCSDYSIVRAHGNDLGSGGEVLSHVLKVFDGDTWRIREFNIQRTDHLQSMKQTARSGPASLPSPQSPQSPYGYHTPLSPARITGAVGALENFIPKLSAMRKLSLDNWTQNAILNLMSGKSLKYDLQNLTELSLFSSAPTYCCIGIPWSQLTRFTSYNCEYQPGQLLELLGAMPRLQYLDLRLAYNETGLTPPPAPYPTPLPSPSSQKVFFSREKEPSERDSPTSDNSQRRQKLHLHLPELSELSVQGLLKSIQLLLRSLKTPKLTTLKLYSYEAGIGVRQVLPNESPCESLYRFLRRSNCEMEWMRVDTTFLVPPQPHDGEKDKGNLDTPLQSYILKPTFLPLRCLKTLVIGRGPPEIVVRLLLALAWRGVEFPSDESTPHVDAFPGLEELGCEMKLGHVELDALCAIVMSRIPSKVVLAYRPQPGYYGNPQYLDEDFDSDEAWKYATAKLCPICPINTNPAALPLEDQHQFQKFPARLHTLHVPSAKSNVHLKLRHAFRSWFPGFLDDPDLYLPCTLP